MAAVLLMIGSSAMDHVELARWGVLAAIVAGAWSVIYAVGKASRRVVQATARELAFANRRQAAATELETGELRVMR